MCVVNEFRKKIGTLTDVKLFHQTLDKNKNYYSLMGFETLLISTSDELIFIDILLLS